MKKLFLIGGMPASGKTTLGKKISTALGLAYLDKDTLCDLYTNFTTEKLSFPNDRSSELYLKTLRPLEYEILWKVALEQISLGLSCVCVAPFSSEFVDLNKIKALKEKVKDHSPFHETVCVLLKNDLEVVKDQMIKRNRLEDQEKIKQWESYSLDKKKFQEQAEKNVDVVITPEMSIDEIIKKIGAY